MNTPQTQTQCKLNNGGPRHRLSHGNATTWYERAVTHEPCCCYVRNRGGAQAHAAPKAHPWTICTGAEGGRSLLGVARGVLRFAPFCMRALPIPEPCGRALPIPALEGRIAFERLPFSLRALGGRLLGGRPLLPGRGVGVFGRPLLPGRGVGVLRVGLRPPIAAPGGMSLT
jgi:hypothetical protein